MLNIEVVPAQSFHAFDLAPKLRPHDLLEIRAAGGWCRMHSLLRSLRFSRAAWAGLVDGEVVCLFGVCDYNLLLTEGAIWLCASDKMYSHKVAFARRNKAKLKEMCQGYQRLGGFVHCENVVSIHWLKWLGFKVSDDLITIGDQESPHRRFEMNVD